MVEKLIKKGHCDYAVCQYVGQQVYGQPIFFVVESETCPGIQIPEIVFLLERLNLLCQVNHEIVADQNALDAIPKPGEWTRKKFFMDCDGTNVCFLTLNALEWLLSWC